MQTVLLVDDENDRLAALERAAKGEDRRLLTARDSPTAINLLREEDVDVIVTDLALRTLGLDEDGFEILEAARTKDPDIPVIVVSSYLTPKSTQEALDLGAFDIIDRGAALYEPQDMLRLKINQALRFRHAVRHLAAIKHCVPADENNPA